MVAQEKVKNDPKVSHPDEILVRLGPFSQPWTLCFPLEPDWATLDHVHTCSPVKLTKEMID